MANDTSNYPDFVFIAYDEDFSAQTHDVAVSLEAGSLVGVPLKYVRHDLNTRPAAPVEGLERYSYNPYSNHGCSASLMEINPTGEYILFSQAEDIIAAERARYHALEEIAAGLVERTDKAEADNAALTARGKELEDYAREATKAITGLSGGGSENFNNPIGDLYPADLPSCLERVRERYVSRVELKRIQTQLVAKDAELEAIMQAITDPENQPSQFGTVTVEYMERQLAAARKALENIAEDKDAPFRISVHARAALEAKP